MQDEGGQVPAPRRPGRPLFRRSAPTPSPAPRVADLSALLADIDALRTTLSTDLTLAAAALEAGADDLAGELVDGDLDAVRAFEARALAHLSALDATVSPDPVTAAAGDATPAATPDLVAATAGAEPLVAAAVVVPLKRRRLMAAAPLVAAAAAVIGLFSGVVPSSTPVPATATTIDGLSQANYSLAMLSELASQGASTSELRDAARQLNDELAELVAVAQGDPLAAQQALLLLQESSQVLHRDNADGALSDVLARTRELQDALRRVLPTPRQVATTPVLTALPAAPPPASPRAASPKATRAASSRPAASTAPSPSASPKASTAPSTPASTPDPSSSSTPSPTSSPTAADPFPRPPGLPG